MKISVFGLGYVGSVSMACFSSMGHSVIGVDSNNLKNNLINRGKAPIYEPGLEDLLTEGLSNKRIEATLDITKAVVESDISLICVGTPSNKDGSPNLDYVKKVVEEIGVALKFKNRYHLILVRSTIPPKTIETYLIPILEQISGLVREEDFGIGMNPEFLRESTAIDDFFNPERVVIGISNNKDFKLAESMYSSNSNYQVDAPIFEVPIKFAELIKYIDNSYHALKVDFANEVGSICNKLGIDSKQMMEIFTKDKKLNISSYYFRPGFSFGGSCLPKDVKGLQTISKDLKLKVPLISSLLESNSEHYLRFLSAVKNKSFDSIGFIGLTFKDNTDDVRENKVIDLIKEIGKRKSCKLYVFDKILDESQITSLDLKAVITKDLSSLVDNCDLIVLNTNDKKIIKLLIDNEKQIVDLNNMIPISYKYRISII